MLINAISNAHDSSSQSFKTISLFASSDLVNVVRSMRRVPVRFPTFVKKNVARLCTGIDYGRQGVERGSFIVYFLTRLPRIVFIFTTRTHRATCYALYETYRIRLTRRRTGVTYFNVLRTFLRSIRLNAHQCTRVHLRSTINCNPLTTEWRVTREENKIKLQRLHKTWRWKTNTTYRVPPFSINKNPLFARRTVVARIVSTETVRFIVSKRWNIAVWLLRESKIHCYRHFFFLVLITLKKFNYINIYVQILYYYETNGINVILELIIKTDCECWEDLSQERGKLGGEGINEKNLLAREKERTVEN